MSGKGFSYGLNIPKKSNSDRPQPGRRKIIFDDDSDLEEETEEGNGVQVDGPEPKANLARLEHKGKLGSSKKPPISVYGDLSTSFTSKKHADTAEELDASIYDYDAVYDSLKPQKKVTQEDKEKKPKYMSNLLAAAAVRKRDATIAEEKKLAREREAEGEEYADKEKFVTSAYKKQQEESRRLEEEERLREEQDQQQNKGAGMTQFFKNMLEKDEERHAQVVKAVEDCAKNGAKKRVEDEMKKTDVDIALEISQKTGAAIAINDEGQVVDKRELLIGGLNVIAKPTSAATSSRNGPKSMSDRSRGGGFIGAAGGKQAMRERQSRMMEAQLEQATKRGVEEEEEEREKVERATQSRKTEADVSSAKERYLARKREAAEAKGAAEQ